MPLGIIRRPAAHSDAAFVIAVEEAAMRAYAEQTWGRWLPSTERQGTTAASRPASLDVIEVDGLTAGTIAVEQREDHIFLAKLILRQAFRSRGVGAHILASVVSDARQRDAFVRLSSLVVNTRAQDFYLRNGFRIESRTPERVLMSNHMTMDADRVAGLSTNQN